MLIFLFFCVFQTFYHKLRLIYNQGKNICKLKFVYSTMAFMTYGAYWPPICLNTYVWLNLFCWLMSNFFVCSNHVFPVSSMEIKSQNSQKVYLKDCFPYSYCKYLIVSDLLNPNIYFSQCTISYFHGGFRKIWPKMT